MSKLLQLRGGTTSEHSTFTGALREVTVDTTKDTLVVHDGTTAGGHPLSTAADVAAGLATLVASAPATLDTLNELAAALGDDANYAATTATALGTKLPMTGGAMTGAITTNSTFDGRSVSVDGTKLDNVATPVITSASVTAVNASNHVVSTGGITITLPASPTAGDYVIIKDGTGAAATTSFTVARNGSNIASSATDLVFDKNFAEVVMTYIDGTIGWTI